MKNYSIILIFVFLISSCRDDDDTPIIPFGYSSPDIYGIYLTDLNGTEYGIYGLVHHNTDERTNINFISKVTDSEENDIIPMGIYPNPMFWFGTIYFDLQSSSLVEIYAIRGNDKVGNINLYPSGFNIYNEGAKLKNLDSFFASAGRQMYKFDLSSFFDEKYGFYRIYVYLPNEGYFNYIDILFTNNYNILNNS